jgi:hypothetical protein
MSVPSICKKGKEERKVKRTFLQIFLIEAIFGRIQPTITSRQLHFGLQTGFGVAEGGEGDGGGWGRVKDGWWVRGCRKKPFLGILPLDCLPFLS